MSLRVAVVPVVAATGPRGPVGSGRRGRVARAQRGVRAGTNASRIAERARAAYRRGTRTRMRGRRIGLRARALAPWRACVRRNGFARLALGALLGCGARTGLRVPCEMPLVSEQP